MSASEKLQALYDEHARALAEDSGTLEPYRVYSALPQIVAVVEASERITGEQAAADHPDFWRALRAKDAAVAALEDALS